MNPDSMDEQLEDNSDFGLLWYHPSAELYHGRQ